MIDDRNKRSAEGNGPRDEGPVEAAPVRASEPDMRAANEIVNEHLRRQMEEAAKWLTD